MKTSASKNINAIFIIFLCGTIILLAIKTYRQRQKIEYYQILANSKDDITRGVFNELMRDFYQNECSQIDTAVPVFSYNELKNVSINSVLHGKTHLIVRLSRQDCKACIDSLYFQLSSTLNDVNDEYVIVFSDDPNPRKVIVQQRLYGVRFPVFQIEKGGLPMIYEGITPYLFILDENGEAKMMHKFDVKSPGLTKNYLEIVSDKFFRE